MRAKLTKFTLVVAFAATIAVLGGGFFDDCYRWF